MRRHQAISGAVAGEVSVKGISLDFAINSFCFLFLFSLVRFMENCNLSSLLRGDRFARPVVEKSPPPTECILFQIPLGIVEIIINDCYDGQSILVFIC